jgi:hypothetical protein
MIRGAFLFVLLVLLGGATPHPVHVSVTEIAFDEKERELEIVSRIFLDDLERSIRDDKKQPGLNLLQPGGTITTDQLVSDYLTTRFKVSLNGKTQRIKYLGHEVESEAVLCYIQVLNVRKVENIEVSNTVLTELYEDQSNLVHVTVRETVKSLRLMRDTPSGKLTFDSK